MPRPNPWSLPREEPKTVSDVLTDAALPGVELALALRVANPAEMLAAGDHAKAYLAQYAKTGNWIPTPTGKAVEPAETLVQIAAFAEKLHEPEEGEEPLTFLELIGWSVVSLPIWTRIMEMVGEAMRGEGNG